jgi:hypothetical protein
MPSPAFQTRQVGYSLNALVDFPPDDPIAILKHLLVGSEGTLGFISNVTYNTVPEVHHKVRPVLQLSCHLLQLLAGNSADERIWL